MSDALPAAVRRYLSVRADADVLLQRMVAQPQPGEYKNYVSHGQMEAVRRGLKQSLQAMREAVEDSPCAVSEHSVSSCHATQLDVSISSAGAYPQGD